MFTTPGGNKSPISSIITMIEAGVCSAGFKTEQLPAAKAGASFHVAISNGKFHGTIWPTTPSGSGMLYEYWELFISATEPSSALITPAKYLQWSITSGKSAAIHSLIGLPLSKHSAVANTLRFFSMTSAILRRMFDLSVIEVLPQVGKAAWAASNAASTSFSFDRATEQSTSFEIGDVLSKYFPDFGSTNLQ